MTLILELKPETLKVLEFEAASQGRAITEVAADALDLRFANPESKINAARTFYDELADVLGPVWASQKGAIPNSARLSEVEAACDPFPGE